MPADPNSPGPERHPRRRIPPRYQRAATGLSQGRSCDLGNDVPLVTAADRSVPMAGAPNLH